MYWVVQFGSLEAAYACWILRSSFGVKDTGIIDIVRVLDYWDDGCCSVGSYNSYLEQVIII